MDLPNGVTIDPQLCPVCGNDDGFQEVGMRSTWQGCRLALHDGKLVPEAWSSYETGDDTEGSYFECVHCLHGWRSLEQLQFAMTQTRMLVWVRERAKDALDVLDRNVSTREPLYAQIESLSQGGLDPRDLTRADPDPFIRSALDAFASVLEEVPVG